MRIAYLVADRHIPLHGRKGASVHVQETVAALISLGHDVVVYAADAGIATVGTVLIGCEVVSVELTSMPPARGTRERRAFKEREAIQLADRLCRRVIDEGERQLFDFIYERYSLFSRAGIEAAARLGVPALVEVNSPLIEEQLEFRQLVNLDLARGIERAVFSRATCVLTVSREIRDYVLSVTTESSATRRVRVLPNGVDVERFHPGVDPAESGIPAGRVVVGFSGSLKYWHGIDILLEAFREARRGSPALHLLVVGDGPMRDWINGYRQGAGLCDWITLAGWIDNPELPAALANMDIAVAPYPQSSSFYFSPLKLYEYFAMGVPVVASAIGQIDEIVEHDKTGLLCEPGDVRGLAAGLVRLARDEPLRQRLAGHAVAIAAANTWRHNAQKILAAVPQPVADALPR